MQIPIELEFCSCGKPKSECTFLPWHYGEGHCG
jgi:hypothetical protein